MSELEGVPAKGVVDLPLNAAQASDWCRCDLNCFEQNYIVSDEEIETNKTALVAGSVFDFVGDRRRLCVRRNVSAQQAEFPLPTPLNCPCSSAPNSLHPHDSAWRLFPQTASSRGSNLVDTASHLWFCVRFRLLQDCRLTHL